MQQCPELVIDPSDDQVFFSRNIAKESSREYLHGRGDLFNSCVLKSLLRDQFQRCFQKLPAPALCLSKI